MNATPSQIYAAHLPQHLRSFELSCEIKAYNGYTKSASPPRAYTASHQPAPLQNSRSSLHYRNRFPTRASISTINAGSISTSTSTSRPPLPLPLLNLHPPLKMKSGAWMSASPCLMKSAWRKSWSSRSGEMKMKTSHGGHRGCSRRGRWLARWWMIAQGRGRRGIHR